MKTFPDIEVKVSINYTVKDRTVIDTHQFGFNTILRVKHADGLYYKIPVYDKYKSKGLEGLEYAINDFTRKCYSLLLVGKVILGKHELDEDQTSEADKLLLYYGLR